MIVASSVPKPKKAISPAPLNMPIPTPTRLPFSVTSACASLISERISSGTWVVSWFTMAPRVGSDPFTSCRVDAAWAPCWLALDSVMECP